MVCVSQSSVCYFNHYVYPFVLMVLMVWEDLFLIQSLLRVDPFEDPSLVWPLFHQTNLPGGKAHLFTAVNMQICYWSSSTVLECH